MMNQMVYRAIVFISTVGIVTSAVCAESGLVTVLRNAGFEEGADDAAPADWTKFGWGPALISRASGDSHGGSASLKVVSNGESWHYAGQPIVVAPGRRYCLAWWAKTDGSVGGQVQIRGVKPDGTIWGEGAIILARQTFTPARWKRYEIEFTVPAAVQRAVVLLGTSAYRLTDTFVLYDDLTLTERPGARAGARKQPSPSAQRNLVINGSFEFGVYPWILHLDRVRYRGFHLDTTAPFEGKYCLTWKGLVEKSPWQGLPLLISNWFPTRPGRRYVLSLAVRGRKDRAGRLRFRLFTASGRSTIRSPWQEATLTPKWRQVGQTLETPEGAPVRKLVVWVSSSVPYSMDAVRVTENVDAKPAVLRDEFIGVEISTEGGAFPGVFDRDAAATIHLETRNVGREPRRVTVEYHLRDVFGKDRLKGQYEVSLAAGRVSRRSVKLDASVRGRFDWVTRLLDNDRLLVRETATPLAVLTPVRSGPELPFGANCNGQSYTSAGLGEDMALLRRYGFSHWRLWLSWMFVQKDPDGPFDWREPDRQVRLAVTEQGYAPLVVLCTTWDRDSWRTRELRSGDLRRWKLFVRAAVARYKDRVRTWEVLNEWPLSPEGSARRYVEIAKATWEAAKAADPHCVLVTCSGSSGPRRHADVRDFLRLGGGRFTDAIGVHPYPELGAPVWQDLQGTIRRLREWSRGAGFEHPVWLTEAGNYTAQGGYHGDGDNLLVASADVQGFLITWAERSWLILHAAAIGLNSGRGLYDPDMVPNAVVCAVNALAEQLQGADRTTWSWLKLPKELGGVYGMRFRRGDEWIAALWRLGEPQRRTLVALLQADAVSMLDMFGNPVDCQRGEQGLAIPITNLVSYLRVRGVTGAELDESFARAVELAADNQTSPVGFVVPGELFAAGNPPPPAGPFAPDEQGFIRDWLVMGPFANVGQRGYSRGFEHDFLKALGGESTMRLRPGMSVIYEWPRGRREWGSPGPPRGEVKARPVHAPRFLVDLTKSLTPTTYVVAYAYGHVTVPDETRARLAVGSDDGIKVWINGRLALDRRVYRGLKPDDDQADVSLNRGENRIMVKVDTDKGGWAFCLRFLDDQGRPARGLKVTW